MIRLIDVYEPTGIRRGAMAFLYNLLKERDLEMSISHRVLPSYDEHMEFITRRPYRCWFLITIDDAWAGSIYATHFNEIGVAVQKNARGTGIGPAAIRELMRTHKPRSTEPGARGSNWLANIAPNNTHSAHVFTKLGFKLAQHTYELPEEEHHGKGTTEEGPAAGTG